MTAADCQRLSYVVAAYSRTSKSHSRIRALRCRSHTAMGPRLRPQPSITCSHEVDSLTPRQIVGVLFAGYERVCDCPRNDEHMQRVNSVGSGLLRGGGSRAQRVCSAVLVTVCVTRWCC